MNKILVELTEEELRAAHICCSNYTRAHATAFALLPGRAPRKKMFDRRQAQAASKLTTALLNHRVDMSRKGYVSYGK